MGRVIVVGSLNVDYAATVRRAPDAGETVEGLRLVRSGGGKGGNQAVAAARVGATVELIGAVGADADGDRALRELESRGVGVRECVTVVGSETGTALIVVDATGQNRIIVVRGANAVLDPARVEAALIRRDIGRGDVILCSFEVSDRAVLAAAQVARTRGALIIVNPAPARALEPELIACAPILTPNESEAEALTGESNPVRAARVLSDSTEAAAIVTLGRAGSLLVADQRLYRFAAPATLPVDTTGAGDTLNGILAAELASGSELTDAVAFATAGATLSTRAAGARAAMPSRDEIQGLLAARDSSDA